jgi:hypothetical protein
MGVKWGSSPNQIKGILVRSFDFYGKIVSYERPGYKLKFGDVTLIEGVSHRSLETPNWANRRDVKVTCELEHYFWNNKYFKVSAKFYNIKLTDIKDIKKYLFTKYGYPTSEDSGNEEGVTLNRYNWNLKDIYINFEESEFPSLLVVSKKYYEEMLKTERSRDLQEGVIYDYSRRKYGSLSKETGIDSKTIERLSPYIIRVDVISLRTPDEGWTRAAKDIHTSRISRTKYEINCEKILYRSLSGDSRGWESIKRQSPMDTVRELSCSLHK